ncbi:right-handed parallel beta-helix repeat-containing protein [Lysobacter firmicutimachus]|uniref:Right-handed parallel beta-helix repeat-containing protein n=1 Tax=Lysobacter firmicutimachus TaxID=1792846 RepID=A0ABU8D327_9GAMM
MRIIAITGLALSGLMFSASAFACENVLDPQQVQVYHPGKYCLSANRILPIEIQGSNIELDCRSRSVIAPPGAGAGPAGIRAHGENVIVRNCRVDGFDHGIELDARGASQLVNNTVVRAKQAPLLVHGNRDPYAEPIRITGNRVFGYFDVEPAWSQQPAIQVIGLNRAILSNNVVAGFRGGRSGLMLVDAPDTQLIGNQFLDFEGSDRMIRLEQSPRARVVHNTIMQRDPSVLQGIAGAVDATCVENVFINTQRSGFSECAVTRHNVERPLPPQGP